MKKCGICEKPTNAFSLIRVENGIICRKCSKSMPSVMKRSTYKTISVEEAALAARDAAEMKERFSPTCSLGTFLLDEPNGLFGLKTGKNNIFSLADLTDIRLTCTSPASRSPGKVSVNVEVSFSLQRSGINHREIIARNLECKTKRYDETHVTWEEPAKLGMFRTILCGAIDNTMKKAARTFIGRELMNYQIITARTVFLLPEGYSREDVEERYHNFAFLEGKPEMDTIKECRELLLAALAKKERRTKRR